MIDKAKLIELQNWVNSLTNRERLGMLFLGCACIYLAWYILFSRSLQIQTMEIKNEIVKIEAQTLAAHQATNVILEEESRKQTEITKEKDLESTPAVVTYTVLQNSSDLVKAIFKNQKSLQVTSLKNLPVAIGNAGKMAEGFEIAFNSNYFATLAYLQNMEKLPWCLSWDSLEYKVTNYPNANVVITLHVLNS